MGRAARPLMAEETNPGSARPVAVLAWIDTACWVLSCWILPASPLLFCILLSGGLKALRSSVGAGAPTVSFSCMLLPCSATNIGL